MDSATIVPLREKQRLAAALPLSGGEMRRLLAARSEPYFKMSEAAERESKITGVDVIDTQAWDNEESDRLVGDVGFIACCYEEGKVFWLGDIPVREAADSRWARRGRELFRQKLIDHPFAWDYMIGLNAVGLPGLAPNARVGLVIFIWTNATDNRDRGGADLRVMVHANVDGHRGLHDDIVCAFELDDNDDVTVDKRLVPGTFGISPRLCASIFYYALQMINTDGVEIECVIDPEKLQKARKKSGKRANPPYLLVHSQEYVTLLRQSRHPTSHRGGTHASPIPHLRRGHRRWLDKEQTRRIFVRDCLVNGRKEELGGRTAWRQFYDASRFQDDSSVDKE